jgi:hypothetical protein
MSNNQTAITAGVLGFLICTAVFIVSFVQQLAYVEVASCLAAWAQLFIASMPILEAFDDKQISSLIPTFVGAALTVSVVVLYAIRYHLYVYGS